MSESSASTWEDHPVTLLGSGVLDGTVDGDTLNRVCEIIPWAIGLSLTAQRIEAASALGIVSGMGVTSELK